MRNTRKERGLKQVKPEAVGTPIFTNECQVCCADMNYYRSIMYKCPCNVEICNDCFVDWGK
jgi:hypothetical protein